MRTLRVVASLLAFPCPFNEVGFPSVSPFWAVFNLAPFNNLRSDYPLDSRSAEWLILDRIRDTDMVGCLLRSDASASVAAVKLRSKVSRRDFDATQKVPVVPLLGNWSTWHRPNAVWVDVAFAEKSFLDSFRGYGRALGTFLSSFDYWPLQGDLPRCMRP